MTEQSFETLKTWQKAHQLMLDIHKQLVPVLPKEERCDLVDQIRRSSQSVAANIAEGAGRFYYMDNVRFCYNARGSLDETLNHLIAARFGILPYSVIRGLAFSNGRDPAFVEQIHFLAESPEDRSK